MRILPTQYTQLLSKKGRLENAVKHAFDVKKPEEAGYRGLEGDTILWADNKASNLLTLDDHTNWLVYNHQSGRVVKTRKWIRGQYDVKLVK